MATQHRQKKHTETYCRATPPSLFFLMYHSQALLQNALQNHVSNVCNLNYLALFFKSQLVLFIFLFLDSTGVALHHSQFKIILILYLDLCPNRRFEPSVSRAMLTARAGFEMTT